ncbi:MAG TPA: ScyD/ScyE family protein [Thermomicrobiales bacterium]
MRHRAFLLLAAGLLLLLASPTATHVAAATPPTVVASGLVNPKGFTWGADGTIYVALADRAGGAARPQVEPVPATPATAAAGAQPTVPGVGEVHAGTQTGSVVKIVDGCPVTVASGFPSATDPNLGWAFGVSAVAFLDGQLYALVDGGGASTQNPDLPNGVYRVNADGTHALVADLSAWLHANEVSDPHEPLTPDGEPFAMIAGTDALWVSESNHEQLLRITPDGAITRVVDFSPLGDVVPTGLAPAPDGGLYVGFLSPLPFAAGTAKVMKVDANGQATDVWTGLTAVTAVAVGPDGTLYATELTTGPDSGTNPPFVIPGTGKIVKQTGPSSSVEVATGLSAPTSLAFGADGGLYVGGPAIGAYDGEGMIVRLDPSATSAVDVSTVAPATTCSTTS